MLGKQQTIYGHIACACILLELFLPLLRMESPADRKNHLAVEDGKLPTDATVEGSYESNKALSYTLPRIRYTTVIQTVLFLDLVSSVTLWLCGGNGKYLEKGVKQFTIRDSVFDLAVLSFLRASVLFFVFAWLEDITLKQIDELYEQQLSIIKRRHHCVILFLSIGSLAYSITKGVFVYKVRSEKEHQMHSTYYALVISAVVFSFLESCFAIMSFKAMRKLKLQRLLHTNETDGNEKKKRPSLRRLITLAKPVSKAIFYSKLCIYLSA